MPDQATPPTPKIRKEKPGAAIHEAAMAAHARTDYGAALELWADLRQQAPKSTSAYIGAIRTAKAAGRDELVEPILREGQPNVPRHADRLAEEAAAPSWEATDEVWHTLMRAPKPDRHAELDAALTALRQRHLGKVCTDIALARLDVVRARSPRYSKAYVEQLLILRKAEQYDRAIALSTEYLSRFPNSDKLGLAHVSLLSAAHRYDEAYEAMVALRKTAKPTSKIEAAYVRALCLVGRLDEAEEAATRAAALYPKSESIMREHASVASHRGEWAEALRLLREASEKWPNSAKIKKRLNSLRVQMPEDDVAPPEPDPDADAAIFARFESLGGSQIGCEFGLVQRAFGSVTLGLLRWTTMGREEVTAGIASAFEGLTEPGNIAIKTYRPHGDREEYIVEDTRYGFNSHTFIEVKDAQADKLLVQTYRRLTFLLGKLNEDLEIGSKIFVYKSPTPTTDRDILALFHALRLRGPANLLCTIRSDADHPPGTMRKMEDGLFVGYIDYFASEQAPEGCPPINRSAWKEICTQVVAALDGNGSKEAVLFEKKDQENFSQ